MSGSVDLRRAPRPMLKTSVVPALLLLLLLVVALAACGADAATTTTAATVGATPSTAIPTTTTVGAAPASATTATTTAPTTEAPNGGKTETAGQGGGGAGSVTLDGQYMNDEWGYSVDFPLQWKLEEILNGAGCSITDPAHDTWEITAWAEPANGRTADDSLEQQYSMETLVLEADRAADTKTTGTFDDDIPYAYDYWTNHVSAGDYDQYNEVLVAEAGDTIYFVTGTYPVDEVETAESVIVAILDSLAVFPAGSGGQDGGGDDDGPAGLTGSYTNAAFGYSLAYPEDWQLKEDEDGAGCSITSTGPTGELLVNVTVFAEDNPTHFTPVERLEKLAELTANGNDQDLQRDPSTLVTRSVDGADYAVDYWTYESATGVSLHEYVMYVTKGDTIYGILTGYPADKGDEIDPIISAMMDSFKP